jgi:hypothetical protein
MTGPALRRHGDAELVADDPVHGSDLRRAWTEQTDLGCHGLRSNMWQSSVAPQLCGAFRGPFQKSRKKLRT